MSVHTTIDAEVDLQAPHQEQKPDSFFTPWHALLYSGFLAAVWLFAFQVRHRLNDAGSSSSSMVRR